MNKSMTKIYSHKGLNYLRIISLIILITFALFSIYLICKFGFIYIPFLLGALVGADVIGGACQLMVVLKMQRRINEMS